MKKGRLDCVAFIKIIKQKTTLNFLFFIDFFIFTNTSDCTCCHHKKINSSLSITTQGGKELNS